MLWQQPLNVVEPLSKRIIKYCDRPVGTGHPSLCLQLTLFAVEAQVDAKLVESFEKIIGR